MRNTQGQCPDRTPDRLCRGPWEPSPQWVVWLSSESCTQSQSDPTRRLISEWKNIDTVISSNAFHSFQLTTTTMNDSY